MARPPAPPKSAAKPKRPANLPYGSWLGDFLPLREAEKRLVEHSARGEFLVLGDDRPGKPSAANKIRAGLIRFVLLGGDDRNPVHAEGVMIRGAWIDDALELAHTRCQVRLIARACWFESEIIAAEARLPALYLGGSSVFGMMADGLRVMGDLFLNDGFTSRGEVRLLGAEIGGDFSCIGGTFTNEKGYAINADRLKVKGGVFLRGFRAKGEVRMLGAEIGGSLSCPRGTILNERGISLNADGINVTGGIFLDDEFTASGEVRLLGSEIDGDLNCTHGTFSNEKGQAIALDGAVIRGAIFFRGGTFTGTIGLTAAYASTLVDNRACYEKASLILDGFRYDRIVGPTDAKMRIEWLKRQRVKHLDDNFAPHPWEQLITVLREMGHPAEAAEIAIEKQKFLRRARKIGRRRANPSFTGWVAWVNKRWVQLANGVARGLHRFYGWIAGYGHRPSRIAISMLIVCGLWSLPYYGGREYGLIGPTDPLIHHSAGLQGCGTGGDPDAAYWTSPACRMPPEYSTFQPFFYSFDVILPLVDLHQEAEWGPVVTNSRGETLWWGRVLRWAMWFEIIFGWVASLMFVAIVGRLVDKD